MDLKDLYQQLILDHGKNPRNLGKFENFNIDAKAKAVKGQTPQEIIQSAT